MASPPPTAEGADKHAAAHQDDQDDGDGDDHQEQPKKKRNLPGTPDPHAEVIALSPKTLMATNRFLCEVCGKGFQRDQNLQLHRRGHNLPWKLKQREGQEIKKRVYVCPEVTCVHHEPSRALGDLTGIKKHFSRKHGEKKWKCEKCSKRYAVQSDWKAHQKVCGTREYRCDCGTLFSRRDTFITHRAYCDALAQENAKVSGQRKVDRELSAGHDGSVLTSRDGEFSRVTDAPPSSVSRITSGASGKEAPTKEAGKNSTLNKVGAMGGPCAIRSCDPTVKVPVLSLCLGTGLGPGPPEMGLKSRSNGSLQWPLPLSNAGVHASNSNPDAQEHGMGDRGSTGMAGLSLGVSSMVGSSTISDSIGPSVGSAEFLGNAYMFPRYYKQPSAIGTQLPATTLLQKAAMMGSTSSRSNLLRSLGRGGDSSCVPQGGSLHDSLSGSVVGTTSSSRLPFSETRGGALCTAEHGGRPLSGKEGAAWGSNSSFSSAKNLLLDGKQNHAEVAQSDSLPDQSRVPDGVAHDCSLGGEPDRLTLDFLGVGGLAVSTGQATTHKDVTSSTLEVGSISRNP